MTENERKLFAQTQIDNVSKLLKGTVSYSTTWDSLGKSFKKITIIYDEKIEKTSS